ncbi:aspartate/glutamate racemase family protein [Polaromonas sp.]|uniref:aspartate/glutamate racemase family protein n=1 Tax=Polaromonas sp. TaxID=1869339 RepID=UPI00286A0BC9|nr:aspartate/glutamate racemase family protein [Polaromonas sp.]
MTQTVLLINPNTSLQTTALMLRSARLALAQPLELVTATAARGASMIVSEADLALSAQEVLAIGLAQATQVDAMLISAFGNPGLDALRGQVRVPVVGIGEAAMLEAASGGRRFGIATTTPGLELSIAQAVARLGLSAQFTGVRIPPGDPLVLAANPDLQAERLADAVRACVDEDGAAAVVIGGGPLAESADRLARQLAVPVISPVAAGMRRVLRELQRLQLS